MLLANVRTPLITSHVVGELQGLQTSRLRFAGEDLRFFWLNSLDFLQQRNFDEQLLRILDIGADVNVREALWRIGPADAGLVSLALSVGCPLITDDSRTLAPHAWGAGVDCRLAHTLIQA